MPRTAWAHLARPRALGAWKPPATACRIYGCPALGRMGVPGTPRQAREFEKEWEERVKGKGRETGPGDGALQVTRIPNNPATQPELYLLDVVGDEAGVSDVLVTGGGSVDAATRAVTIWSISANCSAEKADSPAPAPRWPPPCPSRLLLSTFETEQTDPKEKGASSRAVQATVGCKYCLADCTVGTTFSRSVMRMRQPAR